MKAKKAKPKATVCVFCGAPDPTTWDHVPPKNLFRKPRPANLVTVPSCSDCNGGASKDDEYFRLMMTLREDVRDTGAARWAADSAMRSLRRPEGRGLLQSLLSITEEVDVRTPAGIYLGRRGVYKPELTRLYRVVSRSVRGLFYHERGYPLPQTYNVVTYLLPEEWDVERSETAVARTATGIAQTILSKSSPRIIGRKELLYSWETATQDRDASAWLLIFYQRIPFLTLTAPPKPSG